MTRLPQLDKAVVQKAAEVASAIVERRTVKIDSAEMSRAAQMLSEYVGSTYEQFLARGSAVHEQLRRAAGLIKDSYSKSLKKLFGFLRNVVGHLKALPNVPANQPGRLAVFLVGLFAPEEAEKLKPRYVSY